MSSQAPGQLAPHFNFIGIGEVLVDVISDTISDAISNGDGFKLFLGGQVTNIALNLAQLGVSTALLGAVGKDPLGQFCRNELQRRGVNASYLRTSRHFPTNTVMVGRSRQTPWFIPYHGAASRLTAENVPDDTIVNARVLHTSAFALGHEPMRTAVLHTLEHAAAHGVRITLDPNYHRKVWDGSDAHEILARAYRHVTLTKPSRDDCVRLFGDGLTSRQYIARFHEWGAQQVVMTRGGESALVSDGTTVTELPLPPVEVVDVTGAGDAFWAGMHLALLNDQPLVTAARAGINLAARKIQHAGPLNPDDVAHVALW